MLPSSFLLQLASVEQHCELNEKSEQVQQANMFKRQTLVFHFSTYRPNSCKHPITCPFDRRRESIAAIVASVVETTRQPGYSSSTTLSRPRANFLHQTCIAGLVKYLSPYTGRISDWMAFCAKSFCSQQMNNRRPLFLVEWFQRQRLRCFIHRLISPMHQTCITLMHVWCIGEINRWIKQRSLLLNIELVPYWKKKKKYLGINFI